MRTPPPVPTSPFLADVHATRALVVVALLVAALGWRDALALVAPWTALAKTLIAALAAAL